MKTAKAAGRTRAAALSWMGSETEPAMDAFLLRADQAERDDDHGDAGGRAGPSQPRREKKMMAAANAHAIGLRIQTPSWTSACAIVKAPSAMARSEATPKTNNAFAARTYV
jgi:hypothetical protein